MQCNAEWRYTMFLILTASSDTYITNKIISSEFSASDANVGRASTIDLFRLYNESSLSGVDKPNELTRGLIKFDLTRLRNLMLSELDVNHPSFKCEMLLHDAMGGQLTPPNFNLAIFPLSQAFDEGIGKDVTSYADLDVCNFITASFSNSTNNLWHLSGANAQGDINAVTNTYPDNIDIIISGNLNDGNGLAGVGATQLFPGGGENLKVDITRGISGTLAGMLPDHGFRISFSGSEETDTHTRFVKRFASRHVRNKEIRPELLVSFDDAIQDTHQNSFFNLTGTLFLENFHYGQVSNILSGGFIGPQVAVTGTDCLTLTLESGSFQKIITASQHQAGTRVRHTATSETYNYITGVYSASLSISSLDTTIISGSQRVIDFINKSGSITFDEYWGNLDRTQGFYTGSVTFNTIPRVAFNSISRDLQLIITNAKSSYASGERVRLRVFARDFAAERKVFRKSITLKSVVLNEVYYQVRNADSDKIRIPFSIANNGTRVSTDSGGMYFDIFMDSLPPGQTYTIDFFVKDRGIDQTFRAINVKFKVEE
jgi:hypothetical protein